MISKGVDSDSDALFLDLEDAVAPGEKEGARASVVAAFRELDFGEKARVFRMNALDTPYFYGDVIEVVEGGGGEIDAIIVPKVNRAGDLYALDVLLSAVEAKCGVEAGKVKIEAQIESAEGLENVWEIARATGRLTALHFGPGDFAASVGMPQAAIGVRDEWDKEYPGHRFGYAMQRIVTAARAAGIKAYDGPSANYEDMDALRSSCRVSRSLGFDGKWCIHPKQISVVNETFSPTEEEVERAKEIIAAYEEANASGSGAIVVGGEMVDMASVRMAGRVLERSR